MKYTGKKILTKTLLTIPSIYIAAWLFPDIKILSVIGVFLLAAVLGFLHLVIRPLLLLLALPLNLLTLGLITLLINTWFVMLADMFIPSIDIPGFWLSFFTALMISLFQQGFVYFDNIAK